MRRAVMRASPELVANLGRGRYEVVSNELPDDAKVVGAYYDVPRRLFCVVLESESFADVDLASEAYPDLPVPMIRDLPREEPCTTC